MRDVPSCSYFRSSSMGHSFIVVSHSEENVTIIIVILGGILMYQLQVAVLFN